MFGSELLGAGLAEGVGVVSWGVLGSVLGAGVPDGASVVELSSVVGGGAAGVVAFTEDGEAASQLFVFLTRDLLK